MIDEIMLEAFVFATILLGFFGIIFKKNLVMKTISMDVIYAGWSDFKPFSMEDVFKVGKFELACRQLKYQLEYLSISMEKKPRQILNKVTLP